MPERGNPRRKAGAAPLPGGGSRGHAATRSRVKYAAQASDVPKCREVRGVRFECGHRRSVDGFVGASKSDEGFFVLAEGLQTLRAPTLGERTRGGVEGAALEHPVEAAAGFVETFCTKVDVGQSEGGSRVSRPSGEDLPAEGRRFFRPRAVGQQLGESRPGVQQVRISLDRHPEVALRFFQPLGVHHQACQVEVRCGQARRASERRFECLSGPNTVAQREVDESEVVADRRIAGFEPGGMVEEGQGAFGLRRLPEDASRQEQRRDLVRASFEVLPAQRERAVEVAAAQARTRLVDALPSCTLRASARSATQSGTASRVMTNCTGAASGERIE